jgi:hypothetical protein
MAAEQNWMLPEGLALLPTGAQQLAVAAGEHSVHLVWVDAKTLYHMQRTGEGWHTPVRIAGGEQPALALGADGSLFCVYANWFLGNRDIYLSTWTHEQWGLSQVISRTTGQSSDPSICIAPDGRVHVAWADTTPGYSTIYHGTQDAGGWTYAPAPNGKGSQPTIAANADGVFLAWQDRPSSSTGGAFDVLATSYRGSDWGLPVMVSDSRESHSLMPHIATNATDRCHLVWQEERDDVYSIRHSNLWPNGWEAPFDVSRPSADARLARVMANQFGLFQILWAEGGVLKHRVRGGEPQGSWWEEEVACEGCSGLQEMAAAISNSGELHVVLSRWNERGDAQSFYLKRRALERKKVFVPLATR